MPASINRTVPAPKKRATPTKTGPHGKMLKARSSKAPLRSHARTRQNDPMARAPLLTEAPRIAEIRAKMGLTQPAFARMIGYSPRTVAELEQGAAVTPHVQRVVTEIQRLHDKLTTMIPPRKFAQWLHASNRAFGDRSPLQLVEAGHMDELWRMIYEIESGQHA